MRFLIHGDIHPDALAALTKHEQTAQTLDQIAPPNEDEAITERPSPQELLHLLEKKQFQLLTTDAVFVHTLYEDKLQFSGIIVLILPAAATDQPAAIDRLFERYPRLTPRRLYTITAFRVKIRQLPGAAQA